MVLLSQEKLLKELCPGNEIMVKEEIVMSEDSNESVFVLYNAPDEKTLIFCVDTQHTSVDTENTGVDTERTDVDIEHTSVDTEDTVVDTEHTVVDIEHTSVDTEHKDVDIEHTSDDYEHTEIYLELENLEENVDTIETKGKKTKSTRNQPKKRKQYTTEDLKSALECIAEGMSTKDASLEFHIPVRTLSTHWRLKKEGKREPEDPPSFTKLIDEIKQILTYTNGTPFKSKKNNLFCAYCELPFESSCELREHTRIVHVNDRISSVEFMMRPAHFNEVLRVDIHGFACSVCCVSIASWKQMFTHLLDGHNVKLTEAVNRVIPYILDEDPICALCKQAFTSHLNLEQHMQTHYSNYLCRQCGASFVSREKLRQHEESHVTGKFPCSICNKVFAKQHYRRKHENFVHKKLEQTKCLYCDERFLGVWKRHNHILEVHKDKVSMVTCEVCGKSFTSKYYLTSHKKKMHSAKQIHKCDKCEKVFTLKYNLVAHSKKCTFKYYECGDCKERFGLKKELLRHIPMHVKERRTRKRKEQEKKHEPSSSSD